MNKKQIGFLGEKIALSYLEKKGYKILERNYFSKNISGPLEGEIDIIAKKKEVFYFVEVKTLIQKQKTKSLAFFPEEKINNQKLKKIRKTGEGWLMKNKIPLSTPCQIDILAIVISPDFKKAIIRHFENIA